MGYFLRRGIPPVDGSITPFYGYVLEDETGKQIGNVKTITIELHVETVYPTMTVVFEEKVEGKVAERKEVLRCMDIAVKTLPEYSLKSDTNIIP